MTKHYHVSAGFPGCIPEYNEVFTDLADARESLAWYIEPTCTQGEDRYDCTCIDKDEGYIRYDKRGKWDIFFVEIYPCDDPCY